VSYDLCPYCDAEVEINHDDGYGYEEGDIHQQECGNCGKNFIYLTTIRINHELHQADCLNGAEHNYNKTHTIPEKFSRVVCKYCGDEKPL
jgi:hypothetical protein